MANQRPKILKKSYHVTTQTAYHIAKLAAETGMSEGRVIDKIMRTYLAMQGTPQQNKSIR